MTGRTFQRLAGLLVLASFAVACGTAQADGVPEIREGRSVCDECGMIIDDLSLAAAWRLPDGTPRLFDDIGGMLVNGAEYGDLTAVNRWVFDRDTADTVPAGSATFVADAGLVTPMAWGVVAFARRSDAESMAEAGGGVVLDWDGLVEAYRNGELGAHAHAHAHTHEMEMDPTMTEEM
ncbi:MAG: nitrous oxide reductase accessory protein NosL [Actinobacteria bacterium]|nr:nitrous oxide reductase accessory protein NosL [Actinomycetota bacterium]